MDISAAAGRGGRQGRPHEDLAPSLEKESPEPSQPNDHVVGGGMLRGSAKSRAKELWMLGCGGKYTLMLGGVRCLVQDGFAPRSTHHCGGDQPPPPPRRCSRSVDEDALDSEGRANLIGFRRGEGAWGRLHRGGVELTIRGGHMNDSHSQRGARSRPRGRVVCSQKSARVWEGCPTTSGYSLGANTGARGRDRSRARMITRKATHFDPRANFKNRPMFVL